MALQQQMLPISERLELVFPCPFYSTKPLSENTFNSAMARMAKSTWLRPTAFGLCSRLWPTRQAGAPT